MNPIDRLMSDSDDPNMYVAKCGLCKFRAAKRSERKMREAWEAHRAETKHDIGFLRGNMYKVKSEHR